MDFDNVDNILKYINQIVKNELPIMGDKMVEIMNYELMHQTGYDNRTPTMYERTGQFKEICKKEVFIDSVDGIFDDTGEWKDLDGEDYFPLERWEEGGVFAPGYKSTGRTYPKTNIAETSYNRINNEIPKFLLEELQAKGLDVL